MKKNKKAKGHALQPKAQLTHENILIGLLAEIKPVNIAEFLKLLPDEEVKTRHVVVAVVKYLLETAKEKNWGLCQKYDYTYIYNGAYWKQYTRADIKKFLCDVAVNMGYPEHEARHYQFGEKLLKQFMSYAHLPTPEPMRDKLLINLQNFTFEFAGSVWNPRGFNPDDFLNYQLPFVYDESATCPLFDKYLLRVLPDENSRKVLQEYAGFIFSNLNLEKCLVLIGGGGNGKSVFFNILNALVGKNNTLNYSLGLFSHEYDRAKLTNVLLNYSSERGFDLHPEIFKALVSGEPMQAREPYGKPFTIYNLVKFIINCNELPKEIENTEAYFRRLLIIPFEVKITPEEKDINLAEKIIKSELPGVFNWALEGLNRLVKQKEFTHCESSDKAMSAFRKQADSPQLFIEEYNYQSSETGKVTLTDLYTDYKLYCKENKYVVLGKNRFSKKLEDKGFEKMRRNDGTYFGIERSANAKSEL